MAERNGRKDYVVQVYEHAKESSPRRVLDRSHSFEGHGLQVGLNCVDIASRYCHGKLDPNIVFVAGLLHDIERDTNGHNGHKQALRILQKSDVSDDFTEIVMRAIKSHSDLIPGNSLEERVLWLGDKFEYLSIDRLESSIEGMPMFLVNILFNKYINHWKSRIKPIIEGVKMLDANDFPGIANEFRGKLSNLRKHFEQRRPEFLSMLDGVEI